MAKLDGEVVVGENRIGSITSHNVFGAGFGFTNVDHGLLWVRNSNPERITSIVQYFPPDRLDDLRVVQQNLASTTTSNQTELGARLVGYQVLFGFDIALTEALSLGVKGRRARFESFSDGTGLDRVRSPSTERAARRP